MLLAGLRLTTFITNLVVLISYLWAYAWIERDSKQRLVRAHDSLLLIGLTVTFLLLFHVSSLLNIANEEHAVGYGWTYLNFQIVTVFYALLSGRSRRMLAVLLVLIGTWFLWMTGGHALWLTAVTLLGMWAISTWTQRVIAHLGGYLACGLAFALPFFWVNVQKLGGIDVGWAWQVVSLVILYLVLWLVNWAFNARTLRERALKQAAHRDPMTGLANFGQFDADLAAAYARYQDHGKLYALYTFDIDHFKALNDRYGHLAGNEVLREVAQLLTTLTADLEYRNRTYRTGGEEFSILLFDVVESFDRAKAISRQLQQALYSHPFTFNGEQLRLTISLGQDRATADDKNYLDLYRRADQYLYSSKNSGRDALTIRGVTIRDAH